MFLLGMKLVKRQFRDSNTTLLGTGSVLDTKGFFPCAEGRFLLPAKKRLNIIVSVIFSPAHFPFGAFNQTVSPVFPVQLSFPPLFSQLTVLRTTDIPKTVR